jgi:energy-converting hydrogenase Eha subunit E
MLASSPTRGATRMAVGEIPELTDFFKKMIVTEDDCRAYHDRGWLTGNLVSFTPEVDVPTVEGSTIICFESQLAAGVGLRPSKFLSSIMNYLGCSLVHLNFNTVLALSSFIMLCKCWLGIPPETSLFWYYYSPTRYTKTIFGGIGFSL